MLEILAKIGFDWPVALANFINFIIIFFVLKKFAFGPINKIIEERRKIIDQGLENAQKAETDLMMAEEVKNKKIEEARLRSNQIVAAAQKKSESILEIAQKDALKNKEQIIRDGEEAVAEQKKKIKKEVEKETAQMIVQGIEKIMRDNLTPETQKFYIKQVLANHDK
jgi:F-type H+-transporting ATPase subunit b